MTILILGVMYLCVGVLFTSFMCYLDSRGGRINYDMDHDSWLLFCVFIWPVNVVVIAFITLILSGPRLARLKILHPIANLIRGPWIKSEES